MTEDRMLNDEILLGLIKANGGGGGGGTTNYNDLSNKPQIAGTTLSGDKSLADLGIASAQSVSNITNGESINNFAGVENALSNKQSKLTAGNYIAIENDGTIKVTQGIGVYDVYSYKIEGRVSGNQYYTNVIKYKNGVQQSSNTYYNNQATTPINIDDRFTLKYVMGSELKWHVTLLVDSNEHQAGEDISWKYNVTKDFTETFNVSQDSSTDLATKGDIATALSPILDGQSIDSFSDVETALDGVATTLATKQNATDNSLDTDAKTIVGAINEHEGDIGSLKSGLTTLDTEVNGDATTYPYADVITIEDAVPSNLADCSVKIEPVQDLHGYDKPWVGGAGKNICPPFSTQTISDVTLTWDASTGTAVLNGTNNTENSINFQIPCDSTIAGTEYWLNGAPSDASSDTYYMYVQTMNYGTQKSDYGSGVSFNYNSNGCRVFIRLVAGATANNVVFKPMVCLNSETDKTFAPYTNICPISGHTEVDVQRDGKNLFNKNNVNSFAGYIDTTMQCYVSNVQYKSCYIKCEPNTAYTISKVAGQTFRVASSIDAPEDRVPFINTEVNHTGTNITITTGSNARYLTVLYWSSANGDTLTPAEIEATIQIEKGSTATTYEPYQGKTYTLALGDTIYGGTVDFDSGVLSSYGDIADENGFIYGGDQTSAGGLHWCDYAVAEVAHGGISNMVPKETSAWDKTYPCVNFHTEKIRIYGNFTSLAEFKEQYSGLQVYYQKATPTTIQLTPQQIQLLQGTNTLYASTGQISVTVNGVSGAIGGLTEDIEELDRKIETVDSKVRPVGSATEDFRFWTGANGDVVLMVGNNSLNQRIGIKIAADGTLSRYTETD